MYLYFKKRLHTRLDRTCIREEGVSSRRQLWDGISYSPISNPIHPFVCEALRTHQGVGLTRTTLNTENRNMMRRFLDSLCNRSTQVHCLIARGIYF